MPLRATLGHATLPGPRPRNEDFCGAVTPERSELDNKGILLAVADGVGGHAFGREAAEYVVRGLLADYYATPDTWGVPQSLDAVLTALNSWLLAQGARLASHAGMATTLSAVVLRGTRYYIAHIGDSRVYLWRDGTLRRLTIDHLWDHPELDNVLKRAVGLDAHLAVDYSDGALQDGDVFALVTDGIWHTLGDRRMGELLARGGAPLDSAGALATDAVAMGASDNCTAVVVRIDEVPENSLPDAIMDARHLPLPPRLKPGQQIDGYCVEELLHESRVTLLYRVRSLDSGAYAVLKTLRPEADDAESTTALMHEEWLARRTTAHYFPQVVQHPARSYLYYLLTWHEGATLAQQLGRGHRFSPAEAVGVGLRLLKGLAALHRLGIVHRDIKPDNIHSGSDGRLRVLDLGVAASDGIAFAEINNPGTPSYMAPELFEGKRADAQTDLYAAGVTLYHLLTRKFPYGEIEPFQHPHFGEPVAPTRYRPDVPEWLESVLLKSVAKAATDRFETAEEFLIALEHGAHRPLRVSRRQPLLKRNPARALRWLAAVSVALNLVLVYLLLHRGG